MLKASDWGGAFLCTPSPLAVNSVIGITLNLTLGECMRVRPCADLCLARAMGLQFVQMLPEDRPRLNQFLLQQEAREAPRERTDTTH